MSVLSLPLTPTAVFLDRVLGRECLLGGVAAADPGADGAAEVVDDRQLDRGRAVVLGLFAGDATRGPARPPEQLFDLRRAALGERLLLAAGDFVVVAELPRDQLALVVVVRFLEEVAFDEAQNHRAILLEALEVLCEIDLPAHLLNDERVTEGDEFLQIFVPGHARLLAELLFRLRRGEALVNFGFGGHGLLPSRAGPRFGTDAGLSTASAPRPVAVSQAAGFSFRLFFSAAIRSSTGSGCACASTQRSTSSTSTTGWLRSFADRASSGTSRGSQRMPSLVRTISPVPKSYHQGDVVVTYRVQGSAARASQNPSDCAALGMACRRPRRAASRGTARSARQR